MGALGLDVKCGVRAAGKSPVDPQRTHSEGFKVGERGILGGRLTKRKRYSIVIVLLFNAGVIAAAVLLQGVLVF